MKTALLNHRTRVVFKSGVLALGLTWLLLACSSPTSDVVPNRDSGKESAKPTTQALPFLANKYVSNGPYGFVTPYYPQIVLPTGEYIYVGANGFQLYSTGPVEFQLDSSGTRLISQAFNYSTNPTDYFYGYISGMDSIPCGFYIDAQGSVPAGAGVVQFNFRKGRAVTFSFTSDYVETPTVARVKMVCGGVIVSEFSSPLMFQAKVPFLTTVDSLNVVSGQLCSFNAVGYRMNIFSRRKPC